MLFGRGKSPGHVSPNKVVFPLIERWMTRSLERPFRCLDLYIGMMGRRIWGGDEDGGGEAPRGELTLPPRWRSPPSFLPLLEILPLLGRHHHPHSSNHIYIRRGEGYSHMSGETQYLYLLDLFSWT